jgi:hypothetical protein
MTTIKPFTATPKSPGSKEIVEEFIKSDLRVCAVDTASLGRSLNTVYVSLRQYLANHVDLRIQVSIQDGQLTLTKE